MLQCLYDLVTAATRKEPAEKQTSQTTNLYLWLKQGIGWQRDWVPTILTVTDTGVDEDDIIESPMLLRPTTQFQSEFEKAPLAGSRLCILAAIPFR